MLESKMISISNYLIIKKINTPGFYLYSKTSVFPPLYSNIFLPFFISIHSFSLYFISILTNPCSYFNHFHYMAKRNKYNGERKGLIINAERGTETAALTKQMSTHAGGWGVTRMKSKKKQQKGNLCREVQ